MKWADYSDQLLTEAAGSRKPVIMDFSAAWCAPCRELDEITFRNDEVVTQAAREFVMIKIDLTRRGTPETERLLERYKVKGVPTIVFIDRSGTERQDLRVVDYLPPDQFLIRMAEVKKAQS